MQPKLGKAHAAFQPPGDGVAQAKGNLPGVPLNSAKSKDASTKSPPVAIEELPKKAKVTKRGILVSQYDFGRPITRDQAAQLIFSDGKVPAESKLEKGPGENVWTLSTSNLDDHEATLKKKRGHLQTIPSRKLDDYGSPIGPEVIMVDWSASPPANKGPRRRDLDNDLGFKITKHYSLDPGQSTARLTEQPHGFGGGMGYEIVFKIPMPRAMVMDALFGKNNLGTGVVHLTPEPNEPATTWQVHVIGLDALSAFKPPVAQTITDANNYGEKAIPPGVPKGIREHFEKKTVANDATKHPPNIYVWEQEGFIARVETDGKGKDGYYNYDATRIDHGDKSDKIAMRYFMIEQGLTSDQAWKEYIYHWKYIHAQIVAGFAMALSFVRSFAKPGGGGSMFTPRPISTKRSSAPSTTTQQLTTGTTNTTIAPFEA